MKILIFLLSILQLIKSDLSILSPISLSLQFLDLPYSISNFGIVPYGETVIGQLELSNPLDGCQLMTNKNISQKFLESKKNKKQSNQSKILLIQRGGGCSFISKMKNAEKLGADFVIFSDNVVERSEFMLPVLDNTKNQTDIPSIFIDKSDGDRLFRYLNTSNLSSEPVILNITFPIVKANSINISIWLSNSQSNSFKWLKKFNKEFKKYKFLNQTIFFQPHYIFYHCKFCKSTNYTVFPDNCISGGRYCSGYPTNKNASVGKEFLLEDLKQICIYKLYPNLWWNYVTKFNKKCFLAINKEFCSSKIMIKEKINRLRVKNCMNQSFEIQGNQSNWLVDDNRIMREERNITIENQILFWPSIKINDLKYRGNLEKEQIIKTMCKTLILPGKKCLSLLKINIEENFKEEGTINGGIIGMVLILIVLFALFVGLIWYKKWISKRKENRRAIEIDDLVSRYIMLSESKYHKV